MRNRLEALSQENGFHLIGLSKVLGPNKDRDLYYQADGHWRPLGHRLSAEAIVDDLIENNLVDGSPP